MPKEVIHNVPNPVTLSRVIATPIIMWAIIAGVPLFNVIIAFLIAAFTDFLDGQFARRLKGSSPKGDQVTEFGAKFDIIADRILMLGTIIALIIRFHFQGILEIEHLIQFALITTREVITAPFIIYSYLVGRHVIPEAKFIGKITTLMQGLAFPLLMLNIIYDKPYFARYVVGATAICGIIAARQYLIDIKILKNNK